MTSDNKLSEIISDKGDSFDKVSSICSVIQERLKKQGLDPWASPAENLDKFSTWEERALVKIVSFYCVCSNDGRIYTHLEAGLNIVPELEAIGATCTVKALKDLEQLSKQVEDLENSSERQRIEDTIPGDFIWADPVLDYVRTKSNRFLKQKES